MTLESTPIVSLRASLYARLMQIALLAAQAIAFLFVVERLSKANWLEALCVFQFALAMTSASMLLWTRARRQRELEMPLRQLESLLTQIIEDEVGPEALDAVGGRFKPVAAQIEQLCQLLHEKRRSLNGLEREMRQRVEAKTEALERKIGSLKTQASRDPLTGLLNRRAMDEHLSKAIERNVRTSARLTVMMIDVDNFKPLNDTLGHAAGDELLRAIGQILRSSLRETDAAFRCGGDEFVVILDGLDSNNAQATAQRLTALVDGLSRPLKVASPPRLSIGMASLSDLRDPSRETLLAAADQRLYDVKIERKKASKIFNARDAALLARAGAAAAG